jgi:hypothetical protein
MGSTVISVTQSAKTLPFQVEDRGSDVHVVVNTSFSSATQIKVHFKPGVALEAERSSLLEGDSSMNLRVLRTNYENGQVQMTVEGRPGQIYEVRAYTPHKLTAIGGVRSIEDHGDYKVLELVSPAGSRPVNKAGYVRWQVRVKTGK